MTEPIVTKCCGSGVLVWIPKFRAYCCPCLTVKIRTKNPDHGIKYYKDLIK